MKRLLVAALACAPLVVSAQEPARPPAASAPAFKFPKYASHTLPNGLRVITLEDHSLQVVAVRAVLAVDEAFDPPGKEGLYQVMLGALREGTSSRTAAQLAEASAQLGTPIAPTSFATTPASFEGSFALMGDMLMNATFDSTGVQRRKAAQAAVYRANAARVALVARNSLYTLLNGGGDAVTRGFRASDAAVSSLTRGDVLDFYREHVGPATTTIIIAGDVTDAAALATATKVFGNWKAPAVAAKAPAPPIPATGPTKIYLADIPSGTNAYISMGTIGPVRTDADAYAAEMLGTIVTNRMLAALREKRAWLYAGNMVMNWHRPPHTAEFLGTTSVATAKADSVLLEWMSVLKSIQQSPPTAAELEAARRARIGALWSRVDGPDETAARVAEAVRDGTAPDYLEAYGKGMSAVTAADVAAAAAKYLDLDHLVIAVAGDRKVLEPALRAANIAPVVLIDSSARPIP